MLDKDASFLGQNFRRT